MDSATKRAAELMKLAADYLRDSSDNDRLVHYDDAWCDGVCLADDLDGAREELS